MQIKHLSTAEPQWHIQILPTCPAEDELCRKTRLQLSAAPQIARYKADERTVLDYVSGMSVLVIYGAEKAEQFYLDRVVALQPGTLFSVLPMEESCCVDMLTGKSGLTVVEYVPVSMLESDTKGLQLQKIYTFLYQECSHNFYFRGEAHQPYELVYVDRGELHNLVQGTDIVLPQQSFMIIDSNHWHTQYSNLAVSFLTLSFWAEDKSIYRITNRAFCLTPQLKGLFQQLLSQKQHTSYSHDYIESLLKILLIELLQKADPDTADLPVTADHSENQIVDQAIQIISEHTTQRLTLEALANRVHVSVPYLYKLFQTHLGISPGKYIARIRMEECKVLLRDRQMSMGEVATHMGFSSLQHFSRQFKSICGITPTQYVRSLR